MKRWGDEMGSLIKRWGAKEWAEQWGGHTWLHILAPFKAHSHCNRKKKQLLSLMCYATKDSSPSRQKAGDDGWNQKPRYFFCGCNFSVSLTTVLQTEIREKIWTEEKKHLVHPVLVAMKTLLGSNPLIMQSSLTLSLRFKACVLF